MKLISEQINISSVAVCGAGAMGRGIALSALINGYSVVLYDHHPAALNKAPEFIATQLHKDAAKGRVSVDEAKAALARLHIVEKLPDAAACDLIIEAIYENETAKEELFKGLEEFISSESTIIATNTSSLSISSLGARRASPERFIGLHFFNPANTMKLVEIVRGYRSSDETLFRSSEFIRSLNKTAVIARDVPGFIVNRVARNYYNEAMRIVSEGAAQPEQIDGIMKSIGFIMGPFELMDLIGNDINLEVTKSVWAQYFNEPRHAPSRMQQDLVNTGNYGRKTGSGFYQYSSGGGK